MLSGKCCWLHWLSELGEEASPVFWQSWYVYPHTGVAELWPGEWDFSQITPLLQDMLNATRGRELVFQFGTVPTWMQAGPVGESRRDFGTKKWNATIVWDYNIWHNKDADLGAAGQVPQVGPLHNFSNFSQVSEYFANVMSFFAAGGFTDSKTGKRYDSGFHYDIPWFECK